MLLVLDCDNTLYPASKGIMAINDRRINLFIREHFGLSEEETTRLRLSYLATYGTTLRGLMENFGVNPDEYLDFVHDYSLEGILERNERLSKFLEGISTPAIILTSANRKHAERVADVLGILPYIDDIYDLKRTAYRGKPDAYAYEVVVNDFPNERIIFVDDRLLNFPPAKKYQMLTVLVNENNQPNPEGELVTAAVFAKEAEALKKQKEKLVDFEIRLAEELADIWHLILEKINQ